MSSFGTCAIVIGAETAPAAATGAEAGRAPWIGALRVRCGGTGMGALIGLLIGFATGGGGAAAGFGAGLGGAGLGGSALGRADSLLCALFSAAFTS